MEADVLREIAEIDCGRHSGRSGEANLRSARFELIAHSLGRPSLVSRRFCARLRPVLCHALISPSTISVAAAREGASATSDAGVLDRLPVQADGQ
jgi:hypothetical protein